MITTHYFSFYFCSLLLIAHHSSSFPSFPVASLQDAHSNLCHFYRPYVPTGREYSSTTHYSLLIFHFSFLLPALCSLLLITHYSWSLLPPAPHCSSLIFPSFLVYRPYVPTGREYPSPTHYSLLIFHFSFLLPALCSSLLITHDLSCSLLSPHSDLRLLTGLAMAALTAWKLMVTRAMKRASRPAARNTNQFNWIR